MEIFFRGEIVYQEAVVNESAGKVLPVFTFAYVYIFDGDISAVSLQQIQYQAERVVFPAPLLPTKPNISP